MNLLSQVSPSSSPESDASLSNYSFPACGKRAFTLIELISVMVVMVLILTIAVGSHLMWKRHNALDAVEMQVLAHLSLARQHAITQMCPTTFTASNSVDRGFFWISIASNHVDNVSFEDSKNNLTENRVMIGDRQQMSRQLLWCDPPDTAGKVSTVPIGKPIHLIFYPDASCVNFYPDASVVSKDKREDTLFTFFHAVSDSAATNIILRRSICVNAFTGLARALTREERASQSGLGGTSP